MSLANKNPYILPAKERPTRDRARGMFFAFLVLAFLALLAGCGKPFNVKPKPDKVVANYHARAEINGLTIEAAALRDENYLYDNFEANPHLADLLPVRIRVVNTGPEGVALKDAKFELRQAEKGSRFQLVSASRAYEKL